MALMGLSLPTDVRWERICVSKDMLDPHACDSDNPPKWQSSLAVFRYIPDEEYQVYPHRRILYYKVVATITSYQPKDREIEGSIRWGAVHPEDKADFEERLKTYLPCHGAMLQVTVTPATEDGQVLDYPYFLDFQPKQRILYEQASDTKERMSRSLENLNVRKGAGTTESQEVLDVDQGSSASGQVSAFGTGAGFGFSNTGQWGTKRLGQEEQQNVRTSDAGRESRDTHSHTTQITQLYNLLQAYHLGTNRAIFYLAPRPHVLEEPSGFIRGPRIIDGIQEFFLVVSQREDQSPPCLGVRLDTSHLTKEDLLDYDRSRDPEPLNVRVNAPAPEESAPDKEAVEGGGPLYACFDLRKVADDSRTAPTGYKVESIQVLVDESKNGFTKAEVTPDGRTATAHAEARGHRCFRNTEGDIANTAALAAAGAKVAGPLGAIGGAIAGAAGADVIAEEKDASEGYARLEALVHFVSEQRTVKTGERWVLKVTTRGLCCCERPFRLYEPDKLIGMAALPFTEGLMLQPKRGIPSDREAAVPERHARALTARQANELTELVTETTKQIVTSTYHEETLPALDGAYLMTKLVAGAGLTGNRRRLLARPLRDSDLLDERQRESLARLLGKRAEALTRHDLASAPNFVLEQTTGLSGTPLTRLRLSALGFPLRDEGDKPVPKPPSQHDRHRS